MREKSSQISIREQTKRETRAIAAKTRLTIGIGNQNRTEENKAQRENSGEMKKKKSSAGDPKLFSSNPDLV